jgi:hypothetical protein
MTDVLSTTTEDKVKGNVKRGSISEEMVSAPDEDHSETEEKEEEQAEKEQEHEEIVPVDAEIEKEIEEHDTMTE